MSIVHSTGGIAVSKLEMSLRCASCVWLTFDMHGCNGVSWQNGLEPKSRDRQNCDHLCNPPGPWPTQMLQKQLRDLAHPISQVLVLEAEPRNGREKQVATSAGSHGTGRFLDQQCWATNGAVQIALSAGYLG